MTREQDFSFPGSIAEIYDRHLVPLIFEFYADDLVRRVADRPVGAVLETACGTGVVTKRLRTALPDSVRVVATDLNAGMLAVLDHATVPGVELLEADATALPFSDGLFDAVVCQFGVMFFPDEAKGYREAHRVLRPGGRLLFSVWESLEENPLANCVHEAVVALAPQDPPRFLATPYQPIDTGALTLLLRDAGFDGVSFDDITTTSSAPSAASVAAAFARGTPLAPQLAERGLAERGADAALATLRERYGDGPIEAPMRAIVFEATKAEETSERAV